MKRISYLSFALVLMLLTWSGCNNTSDDCTPSSNCVTEPIEFGELNIKLTIDAENPLVPVTIFKGNVENNDTIYFIEMEEENHRVYFETDVRYSATAVYKRGNQTIRAVDGDLINLKKKNDCGQNCYEVSPGHIDLRLK